MYEPSQTEYDKLIGYAWAHARGKYYGILRKVGDQENFVLGAAHNAITRAAKLYDALRCVAFTTLAVRYIENEILRRAAVYRAKLKTQPRLVFKDPRTLDRYCRQT